VSNKRKFNPKPAGFKATSLVQTIQADQCRQSEKGIIEKKRQIVNTVTENEGERGRERRLRIVDQIH